MTDTKTAILDAAEEGFGAKGIQGVSLRSILAGAGINPALAHYHFGSKQNLLRAILLRRLGPLSQERARRLDELEARPGANPYTLREALRAFAAPAIRLIDDVPHFARFIGQLHSTLDEELRAFYREQLEPSVRRFAEVARRVVPEELTGSTAVARLFFFLGLLGYTLTNLPTLEAMGRSRYPVPRGDDLTEELVTFCEAGLLAGLRPHDEGVRDA